MRIIFSTVLLSAIFLYCTGTKAGDIYFWTDGQGIRHYSNIGIPSGVEPDRITEEISEQVSFAAKKGTRFVVLKVYDGDTLLVEGAGLNLKIRMVGIDAPETGYREQEGQPYGQQSKVFLTKLVSGKKVVLEYHGIGGYNRILAEVFLDDTNVNLEMIRAGLAEVYAGKKPKTLDLKLYYQEEKKARNAGKGMWSQSRRYISPKIWRKEHPWKK